MRQLAWALCGAAAGIGLALPFGTFVVGGVLGGLAGAAMGARRARQDR